MVKETTTQFSAMTSRVHPAFIAAATLAPLWIGAASAADQPDYGGKMSMTVVHQEAKPLDNKGRVAAASTYRGINASIGRIPWMDGAEVLMSDITDLAQGNGPAHGSGFHIKDGAAKAFTYVDDVKTTVVDGKPMTTVDGKVTNASDAPIKDIRVHCVFTSQTALECEWTGQAMKDAAR
jgi:hypothetical protein